MMIKSILLSALFAACAIFGLVKISTTTVHAGTQRVDLADTVKVIVFSTPAPNQWYSRIGLVHSFSDGTIVACFEWKNQVMAECLVIVSDGDTVMVPVRLMEEKT